MFKKLLKQTFDFWCRMRWLKTIDKEIKKRDKCYRAYERHRIIAFQLATEYNKLYPERLRGGNNAKEKE